MSGEGVREPYWANWSAEDKQRCSTYDCRHLRGDHSAHSEGAPCLQSRCLCDEFLGPAHEAEVGQVLTEPQEGQQ